MTLFYVPLEPYKERYTAQWSAPKTGWLERNWIKHGVDYTRIDGSQPNMTRAINKGSVVDAVGRSIFSFSQIETILLMMENGKITSDDVIYFDDFWTPGMEAIAYAAHLLNVKPRMYAFLHAQSVDIFDFTYPMVKWIRKIERGYGEILDGIFVCCPLLAKLVNEGGIANHTKIHVTGHPFNSEEVMERMPADYQFMMKGGTDDMSLLREDKVVYSSRFDAEKNPHFFMSVTEEMKRRAPHVKFVVCTSAPQLRSNDPQAVPRLRTLAALPDSNVEIKEGLTKEEYYAELVSAKVQFNTASQDFVAITLLEASVAGCYPVYPKFRSFPETFRHRDEFMYEHLSVADACDVLVYRVSMSQPVWSKKAIQARSWIHTRFDTSWVRMLNHMGIAVQGLPFDQMPPTAESLFSPA